MTPQAGASSPTSGPTGLVTLIVGDLGRAGGPGTRLRRPAPPASPQGAPSPQAGPGQWSCYWSPEGPGPLSTGSEGEPDLTLTLSADDAQLIKEGLLKPSVAFMQGKLKTSGDNALLLRVLAWSATPAFSLALGRWTAGQSV